VKSVFNIGLCFLTILVGSGAARAATLTVNAGGDLQAAINAAQPGDTIVLQANATFTGNFKLPAKGGTTYITIRSSAPDSQLPPASARMTPASAALLPKIRSTQNGPAIRTLPGATYWRLLFLEFLPGASNASANLVELGAAGSSQNTLSSVPHHLAIDRCYLHGDPGYGQRRGVALNSGDTQITNSYFADFKGVNQDTQAISGWNGPGPYLIENNYLEAAGENIMFGGSDPSIPSLVPAGITIRRNLVSKPLAWMSQSWTVKNLIEFKNAQDVVVEGNTIENNWAAGQQGYSILFTPRNQSNTAPWSVVKNITIRHNVIRHVAAVFNIAGYDNLAPSQQTDDISIVNNLVYDVSTSYHSAGQTANGWFAIIGAGPKNITFDHNTVDSSGSNTIHFYKGASPTGTKIYGFVLKNNLLRDNRYGILGDSSSEGIGTLTEYTPDAYVHANAIGDGSRTAYPTGNDYPSIAQWLADFVSVSAANYQLIGTSLSKGAGTDGKDIGVDFPALNAALAGSPAPATPAPKPPLKDFDGDGKADITVFRPSTGQWFVLQSSGSVATYSWGLATDQPVRGDFDGDGKIDLAVFRASTGQWVICKSSTNFTGDVVYSWGLSTDVPVPGDYDGDGTTDIAVYRPGTGEWLILQSSGGFTSYSVHTLGLSTDVPVQGDYTGDGKTDIAVFRPSSGQWFILQSDTGFGSSTVYSWGLATDTPVPADYDGDGKTDPCIFRPATGQWFILKSSANYASYALYSWGLDTDTPAPADYDGDRKSDPAVFRPSTGQWYVLKSSTNYATFSVYSWGLSSDVPVLQQP
jgi:hypothetical protein